MYNTSNIVSIGELICADGGRNLTPVFKGSFFPVKIKISKEEFEIVKGSPDLMKTLAVEKLNSN